MQLVDFASIIVSLFLRLCRYVLDDGHVHTHVRINIKSREKLLRSVICGSLYIRIFYFLIKRYEEILCSKHKKHCKKGISFLKRKKLRVVMLKVKHSLIRRYP